MKSFSEIWDPVVVVGDEETACSAPDYVVLKYGEFKKLRNDFREVPRLIHLANNPFHAHAFLEANRPGSVLLLHEFSMHHLLTEMTLAYGNRDDYLKELAECGLASKSVAELRMQGVWSGFEQFTFPAIESRLGKAAGVIGHSKWILDRVLADAPDVPTLHVPHHFSQSQKLDKSTCREVFGMRDDELIVSSLGFVTPAKCFEQIIRALAEIRSEVPPFKFWIFGELRHPADLRKAIRKYGLDDLVVQKGYVPLDAFEAAIAASDLIVNLRYPSVGETSGTMTRAMGAGKPVVVYRHGSFAEPPCDSVVGVPLDTFDGSDLAQAFRKYLSDVELREATGTRAKAWASRVSPSDSVQLQSRFIASCYSIPLDGLERFVT
ncbi:MAG: glycosyltransferase family 4 protein [Planctomycetes bacterium]|nr:glycosyltransferase family 4 protein [Planctomycetota bacterium]